MEIVHDRGQLDRYIDTAMQVSGDNPVLIDQYLRDATEVDVDALADGEEVYIAGIMEHIEEAGIHSGDSACSLPPYSLAAGDHRGDPPPGPAAGRGARRGRPDERAVRGPERRHLHPRGQSPRQPNGALRRQGDRRADRQDRRPRDGRGKLTEFVLEPANDGHVAVKESVFPFVRFPGVDVMLGPEMRSTGEVMGLDTDFSRAFLKSQLGAGTSLPQSGTAFISVKDRDKEAMVPLAKRLLDLGFSVIATHGTAAHLKAEGLAVADINKVREGRPHIVDAMKSGDVQLVLNTTEGSKAIADSFELRRTALTHQIPYYTTVSGAEAAVEAIATLQAGQLEVTSLQSYFMSSF